MGWVDFIVFVIKNMVVSNVCVIYKVMFSVLLFLIVIFYWLFDNFCGLRMDWL